MHSFSYSYTVISQMASCTTICPDQIRFHHIMNLYNQPVFSYTKAYPIYRTLLYTNRYCIRMLQILFCASEQIYKNLYLQTIEIIVMWDEKQRCITTEDWSPKMNSTRTLWQQLHYSPPLQKHTCTHQQLKRFYLFMQLKH